MDTHERRVGYVLARYPMTFEQADAALWAAYRDGTADELLTPAQRRRIRHKRAGTGAHRRSQRGKARARKLRKLAHWGG